MKAFITGANKGIGFGIAQHLGLAGWTIVLGARDEKRATQAISALESSGVNVAGWVNIELADLTSVKNAAKTLAEQHPDLTLLINNAGIPGDMGQKSYETDMHHLKETMDVNFFGTYELTQCLIPTLAKNAGRIVNITVPTEVSPYWHPLAYVASKAAQNTMTSIMALEFTKNNIPVETYSIHPGPTTTDLDGNMDLPGFHTADTVGQKVAEVISDGQCHNGEFIELYPIVDEGA
ncbi:MAG: SDR family NAD(P)-dependent oxidoreductase [Bacteroidaceae bacterium]|nr:SDR family NAD(P)-dependent oxidoreductase [Bacteroidaceae bacterium]